MSSTPGAGDTARAPLRLLCLGDSYTIGEGVTPAERWPNVLRAMLRARGIEMADPRIIARTAWTTDELMDAIDEAPPGGAFDLVTLMIGVNDQYRSRPIEQFEACFAPLLEQAIGFSSRGPASVVVLSIPDWGATPFAEGRDGALISREIETYNARARQLVEARGAHWHDVTAMSRRVADDPSLVVEDKLHPSGAMYRDWALSLVAPIESLIAG